MAPGIASVPDLAQAFRRMDAQIVGQQRVLPLLDPRPVIAPLIHESGPPLLFSDAQFLCYFQVNHSATARGAARDENHQ